MHHSSLATITAEGIRFSSDLLTPLSIREKASVWAAYYPTPEEYDFPEKYDDLMITAVPFESWLFAGRFRIWFQQQVPGGLNKLAEIFKANGMSIICSEASRSGHRYATCTVSVCVDSVMCRYPNHKTDYSADLMEEIKEEVNNKIAHCEKEIEERCEAFHFSDKNALGLERPVMGERLDALSYFYGKVINARGKNHFSSQPWKFTCKKGALHPRKETKSLMEIALKGSLPSRAFAEINTREANLRLAIIPKKKLRSFGWVVIDYRWEDSLSISNSQTNSTDSCALDPLNRNIVSDITGMVSKQHNIWRCFSYAEVREQQHEKGKIEFFLRVLDRENNFSKQWDKLRQRLDSAVLDTPGAEITGVSVTPIAFKRIFISIRTNSPRRKEIIDICTKVGSQYGMLREDFRIVDTHVERVLDTIVKEIKDSHAMIQYYGDIESDPSNYDWLHAELLAAQVLDMPVVTIIEGSTPRERIRTLGDQSPIKVPKEPTQDQISKAVQKALDELNNTRL